MLRSLLWVALVASCKRSPSKPPPPPATAGSDAAPPPVADAAIASKGIAKPLRGPYPSVDAYCETKPASDDKVCEVADIAGTGTLPDGLLQVAAVYDNSESENHDVGCAVALRTSAGWFVGPPSAETCREPSYIDLDDIDIDTDEAIAAITFGITWHTKNGDEEAKYKLTALCGLASGTPACTHVFVSQCDEHAPAAGCSDASFELGWTIEGGTATFKGSRKIENDAVPAGTQTIL